MDQTGSLRGDIQLKYEGYGANTTRAAFAKDATGTEWAKSLADKHLDFNLLECKTTAILDMAKNEIKS